MDRSIGQLVHYAMSERLTQTMETDTDDIRENVDRKILFREISLFFAGIF